ncbi:ABC transporter permease subunit [Robertmurraya massiliosenegalensis]|uniref:PhnE/PtxC family ABC transporter permease n=1 Tax=Robertmurraya TaxID=2837507 RepID=UPI0039A75E46
MGKTFTKTHQKSYLTIILIGAFIWSLFSVQWNSELFHAGGFATLFQIVQALFQPNLSPEILLLAVRSTWITLSYAVAGVGLAIVIAFVLGILASGIFFDDGRLGITLKTFFRAILGFLRAIHELVWALIFVASFGLSPYAAIFALALPFGGILGRIFADMLADVQEAPIQALKSTGASKWQLFFYGYFPIVKTGMLSYTMYRFECGIRSSAIMSFVGLGGLGYQIQLSLDDLHYDEVWTFIFFLIAIVVLVDWWSSQLRNKLNHYSKHWFVPFSTLLTIGLLILAWSYIYIIDKASLLELFSERNLSFAKKFFANMFGFGEEDPAFFNWDSWKNAISLTYDTLQMSIMAIGFSTILMFLTVLPAARNVANGRLTLSGRWYSWISFSLIRLSYIFSRAIPELVWAMMIIFIFKPGILPGAIALALHNFGILGKLCAEVVEDLDARPIRHLASSGANKGQILLYGVIPSVLPRFLTYILYRWEVIMRTTIIVGFVGAGGLGQQFKLSMSFFHYSDITLLLFCYIILVWIADFISEWARKTVK